MARLDSIQILLVKHFCRERGLIRRDNFDPLLGELDGFWAIVDVITAASSEEQIKLICLLEASEILDNYTSESLERVNE